MGKWRYQPVIVDRGTDNEHVTMVEVYFHDKGAFAGWAEPNEPRGNDVDDLLGELAHMLVDAQCWVPVPIEDLAIGIEFKKAISIEKRKAVADFIDRWQLTLSDKC